MFVQFNLATADAGEQFVPEIIQSFDLEEETDDEAGAACADESALSHALYRAEQNQRGDNGNGNHAAINTHLDAAESPVEGAAQGQAKALCGKRNHFCLNEGENAERGDYTANKCVDEG